MEKAMNIVLVHGYGLEGSGSSMYSRGLARQLLAEGHNVSILGYRHIGDQTAIAELQKAGGEFIALPLSALVVTYPRTEFPGAKLVKDLSASELRLRVEQLRFFIRKVLKNKQPDKVIANHFLLVAAAATAECSRVAIPIAVVSHGTDIEYAAAQSKAVQELAQTTAYNATACIALNQSAGQRAAEVIDIPKEMFSIIPPGIDDRHFSKSSNAQRPFQIVQVGRLLLDKGPHITIAAFCEVLASFENANLVFVGDGPDAPLLRSLVHALDQGNEEALVEVLTQMADGIERTQMLAPAATYFFSTAGIRARKKITGRLSQQITFQGYVSPEEVSKTMQSSRVLTLPSMIPECFPLTLLEAMAAGCAIAATSSGGAKDVLDWIEKTTPKRGRNARIPPRTPVPALIASLFSQVESWTASEGEELQQLVEKQHHWRIIAPQLTQEIFFPQALRLTNENI